MRAKYPDVFRRPTIPQVKQASEAMRRNRNSALVCCKQHQRGRGIPCTPYRRIRSDMAEYHLNAKFFSRSKGHSAVAAAAYRSGEKLHDERTDTTHNYTRKKGIEATEILVPENAPDWMRDRSQLWNNVERAERRKDSQLCLEFDIALPVELSRDKQKEALRNFAHEQFVSRGYAVDIAYHAMDTHNPHAHLMVPLRPMEGQEFGKKPNRWSSYNEELRGWREAWARHANHVLEQSGSDARIDHRTLKERGIERTPQIHIGKSAWHGQKKGEEFERWMESKTIANANDIREEIQRLEREIAAEEERQRRPREERTAATVLAGTTPQSTPAKKLPRKAREKSRQETAKDLSATTLAGTYSTPTKDENSGDSKQVTGQVEDQRKLIEQFQTIKDSGRERPKPHPMDGDRRPAQRQGRGTQPTSARAVPHPQQEHFKRLRDIERAYNRPDPEGYRGNVFQEYRRELARKLLAHGTAPTLDTAEARRMTDKDIAIRLLAAGYSKRQVAAALNYASPEAAYHKTAARYGESQVDDIARHRQVWQGIQRARDWKNEQGFDRNERRLEPLGLATQYNEPPRQQSPPRSRQRDIEPER